MCELKMCIRDRGYTTFQIYADNVAKSYISGVTSGGALNRTFADIFYREGVKNAESWKNLCDGQINTRRGILDVLAKFYQLYNRFYLKDEYTNALKDQTTATPVSYTHLDVYKRQVPPYSPQAATISSPA